MSPPGEWPTLKLFFVWVAVLLITPTLTRFGVPSHGSTLWLLAALSFAAGVQWRERSLVYLPPLLMFLWLFAATTTPAGTGGNPIDALVAMGMVSFPYAFCGAFFSISRQLAPLGACARANTPDAARDIKVVDVSQLAEVVERIDRSATWRSFLVSAAPFVVLWQFFELYLFRYFVQQTTEIFGAEPMLEDWHYAIAAVLALTPFAFALWDWLDRQDRLRMLALVSGGMVGALAWQAFGVLVGFGVSEMFDDFTESPLVIAGLLTLPVLLSGSGLLAGTEQRFARPLFLGLCGLAITTILVGFTWISIEDGFESRVLVETIVELGKC